MRTICLTATTWLVTHLLAAAQLAAPPGWRWATDGPARVVGTEQDAKESPDALWFVQMPPGFHITMGPGGNLYHPSIGADGRFEVESEFFLFPGPSPEEYGLLLGGQGLDGPNPSWVAFVARKDGSAAVIGKRSGVPFSIRDWRSSGAIVPGRVNGTARNVFKVAVGSEVVFSINGAEVARVPRDSVAAEGTLGFRAGKAVNLHVTTLDLTRRLAPARGGR
jgi:hypothetical protein